MSAPIITSPNEYFAVGLVIGIVLGAFLVVAVDFFKPRRPSIRIEAQADPEDWSRP